MHEPVNKMHEPVNKMSEGYKLCVIYIEGLLSIQDPLNFNSRSMRGNIYYNCCGYILALYQMHKISKEEKKFLHRKIAKFWLYSSNKREF